MTSYVGIYVDRGKGKVKNFSDKKSVSELCNYAVVEKKLCYEESDKIVQDV